MNIKNKWLATTILAALGTSFNQAAIAAPTDVVKTNLPVKPVTVLSKPPKLDSNGPEYVFQYSTMHEGDYTNEDGLGRDVDCNKLTTATDEKTGLPIKSLEVQSAFTPGVTVFVPMRLNPDTGIAAGTHFEQKNGRTHNQQVRISKEEWEKAPLHYYKTLDFILGTGDISDGSSFDSYASNNRGNKLTAASTLNRYEDHVDQAHHPKSEMNAAQYMCQKFYQTYEN